MKRFTIPFLFLGVLLLVCGAGAQAQTGKITVHIETVKSGQGQIGVLLFNQAKGFPGENQSAYREALLPAKKGKMTVTFEDLPYGTYAITILHDENGNLKVDANFLGIPKEGYGFSNNARNLFRAPKFEEAKFELKQPQVTQRIDFIY
ncbi:MAG: DUF2141 domain-containing protein [Haliscomenobacter sp.]|nr:DUF2141 domain-containing protein [Haliscomenobacter sp.]MBK8877467.1 DUF2141 domain-containing protein [Haliscomenobacter sp.]